jgi:formyltetrahydrofolate deformylase
MNEVVLLMTCPDRKGIVARTTMLLYGMNANVLNLEQHVEGTGQFFMRIHADASGITISEMEFRAHTAALASELSGRLSLHYPETVQRVAILVTREDACLWELLLKHRSGELRGEVRMIVSNHQGLRPIAESFGIPFHYLPVTPETRDAQEEQVRALLRAESIELVVLARYMQILSPAFVAEYAGRIINIHHGFLPAFKGSRPYHRAWERGVKIIGATAHYVTENLDEGPIIEQDVISVSHQHSVAEMIHRGRDIERRVLATAVQAHLEHRIILHNNRTIIFHP